MTLLEKLPRRLTYANVMATLAALGAAIALAVALSGSRAAAPRTSGPPLPNVLGEPLTVAKARIATAAGPVRVNATLRREKGGYPIPGRVVMQSPAPGVKLASGARITLGVSGPR